MKNKLSYICAVVLAISCSGKYNYKYDRYTVNEVYTGRASEKAVEKNSSSMKKATCCEGAELSGRMITLRNNSEFTLAGERETNNFNVFGNGKIIHITESRCEDRKNSFEECYCILDIKNKHSEELEKEIANSGSKTGWISINTYLAESKGAASPKAKEKRSLAMRETTCLESSQTNAIKSMIFDILDETNKNRRTVSIKTRLPSIYLKSCESSDNFETCTCKYAFYEEGIKDTLAKEIMKE